MVLALLTVFCTDLRTDSDFCFICHYLTGLYNRGGKCLQRGTDWCLIQSRLRFIFKRLTHGLPRYSGLKYLPITSVKLILYCLTFALRCKLPRKSSNETEILKCKNFLGYENEVYVIPKTVSECRTKHLHFCSFKSGLPILFNVHGPLKTLQTTGSLSLVVQKKFRKKNLFVRMALFVVSWHLREFDNWQQNNR
jgi:hypothetical protein